MHLGCRGHYVKSSSNQKNMAAKVWILKHGFCYKIHTLVYYGTIGSSDYWFYLLKIIDKNYMRRPVNLSGIKQFSGFFFETNNISENTVVCINIRSVVEFKDSGT